MNGTVEAVPVFGSDSSSLKRAFFFNTIFNRKGRFRFRFLKTGTVPLSVSRISSGGSGSGLVPGPSCSNRSKDAC